MGDDIKTVKLICVTKDNNNKFYNMMDNGDGSFSVEYGRVGGKTTNYCYDISEWNSKYNSKIRKGYKDVTHIYAETKEDKISFEDIKEANIEKLVQALQGYAKKSVSDNYIISSENVTQAQIDEAQNIVDDLTKHVHKLRIDKKKIDNLLLELYEVIPRRMSDVRLHLATNIDKKADIQKKVAEEQATLDVMIGQVSTHTKTKVAHKKQTLLDAVGISIEDVDKKDIKQIKSLMSSQAKKFKNAFKITNVETQSQYDNFIKESDNKKSMLLWHGSRNENWWSILGGGLVLKPANAIITGKMFGYGLYFADKSKKSIGYTSLDGSYWAGGNSKKGYLALYEVHLGNWLKLKNHESWMYDLNKKKLKKRGDYDSLFAVGGADLVNNEYIIYDQNQCTVKYLVEIGR